MKNIILAVITAFAMSPMVMALPLTKTAPNAYTGNLVNESGLAYSTTFTLDVGAYAANRVSAVIVYSSGTYPAATFTDGTVSTGNITIVSTATLSGTILTINRVAILAGTDFPVVNSLALTAANLAQTINASTSGVSGIISAQAIGAVVYTTSTLIGGNFSMTSSKPTILLLSGASMTGGTGAGYSAASDIINIPSHGFTLGMPVLYSGTPVIAGLATGTTYFIIPIDANNVYVSSTSTGALAGNFVGITNQHANTTAATYTLAPVAMDASNASAKWQVSNDNVVYGDLAAISTVFISSATAASSSTFWDFSDMNYRYLRLYFSGPTTGGVAIKAIINAKQ